MNQTEKIGISRLRKFLYYSHWFIQQKMGIKKPLLSTMILALDSNLSNGSSSLSFSRAKEKMEDLYSRGARIAYFEGEEPTVWKDGDKKLSDLIHLAKEIGYFTTGYSTNGTGTFFLESDIISVNLYGPKEIHDKIRTPGSFNGLMKNLEKINHPHIFASMVISKSNLNYVAETISMVEKNKKIQGIILNFLTPPPDSLSIQPEEREKAIQLILALKNQKAPILNTRFSLRKLAKGDFTGKCPLWMSAFILPDGTEVFGCPLQTVQSCSHCGSDAAREYSLMARGHIPAIIELSKRFSS